MAATETLEKNQADIQEETEKKVQPYKKEYVAKLKELFESARDYIFTDYRGLSVSQITDLRGKLREKNAVFKVLKNRFAKIAFQQMDQPELGENLIGPTAVAVSMDEAGPVVKELLTFGEEAPVSIKGALIDGRLYSKEQVDAFSKLPTKDELYAMLMGTMQAPVRNLMYALNGVPQKLVRVLQAVAEKKEQEAA